MFSKASLLCLIMLISAGVSAQTETKDVKEKEQPRTSSSKNAASDVESVEDAHQLSESQWLMQFETLQRNSTDLSTRAISSSDQQNLDIMVDQMSRSIPNSWVYNYAVYSNGKFDRSLYPYLEQAYALDQKNVNLFDDFIAHAELTSNQELKKEFCIKLHRAGVYNGAMMEYNRNVLNSVEANGILITYGNEDTYPLWILQEVEAFRKDVQVVYVDLLMDDEYLSRISSSLGVGEFNSSKETVSSLISHLLNTNRPIYLGLTVAPDILKKNSKNLYPTGLAFKHSDSGDLNNLQILSSNWESKFSRQFILQKESINSNYILPLTVLADHYSSTGTGNVQEVQNLIDSIKAIQSQGSKSQKRPATH